MFGLILQKMYAAIAITATITCSTYMQVDSAGEALYDLGYRDDKVVIAHNNEAIDEAVENVFDVLDEAYGGDYGPDLNQTSQDVIDQLPQINKKKEDEEEAEADAEEAAKRQADEIEAQEKKEFEEQQAKLEEEHKKQEEEYKKEIEAQEKEMEKQEDEYKKEMEKEAAERQAQAEQYKQDNGMGM